MELIDKDALVAEIKRIEYETNYEPFTDEVLGKRCVCSSLLFFIDTLEVKDVDLEKEINEWLLHDNITNTRYDDYCDDDIIETANHFFELGLKAQKGE